MVILFSGVLILLVLYKFEGKVWKIELNLLKRYPCLPQFVYKFIYWLIAIFLVTIAAWHICLCFREGSSIFGISEILTFCLTLFFLRLLVTYYLCIDFSSSKWRPNLLSQSLECLRFLIYWTFQFTGACFLTKFNSVSFTSVFMNLNFVFFVFLDKSDQTTQTINSKDFCSEFMKYLGNTINEPKSNVINHNEEHKNKEKLMQNDSSNSKTHVSINDNINCSNKYNNAKLNDVPFLDMSFLPITQISNNNLPPIHSKYSDPSKDTSNPINPVVSLETNKLRPLINSKEDLKNILKTIIGKNTPSNALFYVSITGYLVSHFIYSYLFWYFFNNTLQKEMD